MSRFPSLLKSPVTIASGWFPIGMDEAGAAVKFPVPSPRKMVTVFASLLQTATSSLPSFIKVCHRDNCARVQDRPLRERPVAAPQQDVASIHHNIGVPVTIEVSRC